MFSPIALPFSIFTLEVSGVPPSASNVIVIRSVHFAVSVLFSLNVVFESTKLSPSYQPINLWSSS